MAKAKTDTITTSRRRFLTVAAVASAASATALAAAAMPVHQACTASQDDSALGKLEELIFEQYQGATAYDDEIIRLSDIWRAEGKRLYEEALSREAQAGTYLTPRERWALVTDMPESREHSRLARLQEPFYARMEALIKQMFATP